MICATPPKPTINDILKTFDTSDKIEVKISNSIYCDHESVFMYMKNHYGTFRCIHADDKNEFMALWNHFVNINGNEIIKINTALNAEYNPIHNYDKTDTTTTIDNTVHQYETGDDSTTHETASVKTDGTTITNTVSGNIGVMTTQSMIESEVSLRASINLCKKVCKMFSDEYFI